MDKLIAAYGVLTLVNIVVFTIDWPRVWKKRREKKPPSSWRSARRKAVEGGRKSEWDEVLAIVDRRKKEC